MSNAHSEIYEFDKFRLDVSERILWCETERLPLSEKAFDTLCALVRRGNRLVSKDDLLREVWADAIVEENNLDKNISILRKVFSGHSGNGKFIETVRGHGFRFVADVTREEETGGNAEEEKRRRGEEEMSEPPAAAGELTSGEFQISDSELETENRSEISNLKSEVKLKPKPDGQFAKDKGQRTRDEESNRFRLVAVFGALVVGSVLLGLYIWRSGEKSVADPPIQTIAVLPFKSLGAENRNEALEMGMADTLIARLGGEGIVVRSLGSVSRYAGLAQDSVIAGRELGVETVLDGTIQTSDNRIRISARLFRTSDGKQLWTGQFDEEFTDIFAVQDSISERVAAALKVRLVGAGKKRSTENVEAYQLYMKGRFYLLKATRSETETSISYFQQAIAADPNYALAYAGLSDAYRGQTVGGEMPPNEFMPKAKAAALKAIELDDQLAEGHANLGHIYYWYEWNWKAAEKEHQRALELNPNSPDTLQFYAHLLSSTGRHPEALAKIKRARELDPLNLRVNAIEGMLLLHAGQTDEAISRLQKTLELEPDHRLVLMMAARAYTEKGMFTEAIAATNKAREIFPASSEPIAYGIYALVKSGKRAEAKAALDELLKSSETRFVPPYRIALVYNALGEREKALDYLEKAFAEKDVRMVWLKIEPKWNNLRSEPRFIELMRRMNFESIAGNALMAGQELYWILPETEQLALIQKQGQHIQNLIGDAPTTFDEEALRAIKVEIEKYVDEKDNLSQKPFKEGLRVIYGRASQYAPMVIQTYEARQVPAALGLYQAMVESEYQDCPSHSHPRGPVGLFQFSRKTAAKYGLTPKDYCNVEKQSDAAARYMSDLSSDFGDGNSSATLGLLGFMIGEGEVRDYLRQLRGRGVTERSFWAIFRHQQELQPSLTEPGKRYVPRFFAAAIIGETPEAFELSTPPLTTLR